MKLDITIYSEASCDIIDNLLKEDRTIYNIESIINQLLRLNYYISDINACLWANFIFGASNKIPEKINRIYYNVTCKELRDLKSKLETLLKTY